MSEKYKFLDPEGFYFVTSTIVHWIDLFTRKELKHVIIKSLIYCQEQKGLQVHAYCIMPSHIHMIISSKSGEDLSTIMRDFKRHTSKTLLEEIKLLNESRKEWLLRAFKKEGEKLKRVTGYKIWRDGNHPILLDSAKLIEEKLCYIHENPVESEIVDEPEYYWYSSARDYIGQKGLLPVVLLR